MSDVSDSNDIIEEYENRASENDLAPVSDGERENEYGDDDEGDESKPRRIDPTTSKKHIVRNPQPKLNTERLKGPKGIHTIEKYFEGFKFHGKGHEKADLDRVMKRIEHWAHRLFPKLDYDDFLGRLEALGTKKDLQVFIKKYRMDMITADEDTSIKDIIDDEENEEADNAPIDEFDMLITEQIEKQKQAAQQQNVLNSSANEDAFNQLLANSATNQNSQPATNNNASSQLTQEVKDRIERNRQQAIQRRLARLQQLQDESNVKKMGEMDGNALSQQSEPVTSMQQCDELTSTAKNSEDENMLVHE